MAYFKKNKLSESAFGRGIKVWATDQNFPTLLHESTLDEKDVQELWLFGHNSSDSEVKLYICMVPETGTKSYLCVPLPPGEKRSATVLTPGIPIKNGTKIQAYSSESDKIMIYGYLNQVVQSIDLANLKGFGTNLEGESSHPYAAGKTHEILFDPDGKTVACGDGFSIAVRPNGTVFGWGGGNLVTQLLRTGQNEHDPWKLNVDSYKGNDYWYVTSNGIPPHPTPYKNLHDINPGNNPNNAQEQDYYFNLPNIPTEGVGALGLGRIGVTIDGCVFYNFDDANGSIAPIAEAASLDDCRGHVDQNGVYHYHQWSSCLDPTFDTETTGHSSILGFAFDGYPIYGPRQNGGTLAQSSYVLKPGADSTKVTGYEHDASLFTSGDGISLDMHNGHVGPKPDGSTGYHYHLTIDSNKNGIFPYVIGPSGYKGIPYACNLPNNNEQCDKAIIFPKGLTNVKEIQIGEKHAIAMKQDNTLVAWGDNSYGQCEVPSSLANGVSSMDVGGNHSLAVQAGKVIAWGRNERGQVTTIPASKAVVDVKMISSGAGFTVAPVVSIEGGGGTALGAAGTAVLAGTHLNALTLVEGGTGYTTAPDVVFQGGGGEGALAETVLTSSQENPAFGYVSSINMLNSGEGYTSIPEVLIVDNTPYGVPKGSGAAVVASLSTHAVSGVILSNGGQGYYDQPSVVFSPDPSDTIAGGAQAIGIISGSENAIALPLQTGEVDVSDVTKVSAGISHSLLLKNDGSILTWGDTTYNQTSAPMQDPSQTKTLDILCGGYHTLVFNHDLIFDRKYVAAWGAGGTQANGQTAVPTVAANEDDNIIGTDDIKLAAGRSHSLILYPNGTMAGFGSNLYGQVEVGDLTNVNSLMSGPFANHHFVTQHDIYKKNTLDKSSGGEGIRINHTTETHVVDVERTHVHRANRNPFGFEEVYLWAYNMNGVPAQLDLFLEPRETSSVSKLEITNEGAGYDSIPDVKFEGVGHGVTATSEIGTYDSSDITGYVSNLILITPGSGYSTPPTVFITGGAEDLDLLVNATAIAHIETGERMSFSIPPRSGLHALAPGFHLLSEYNLRASTDKPGEVYIFGYTNMQERGVQATSFLFDNPYQMGDTHTYTAAPTPDPSPDPGPGPSDPGSDPSPGSPGGSDPGGDPYGGGGYPGGDPGLPGGPGMPGP